MRTKDKLRLISRILHVLMRLTAKSAILLLMLVLLGLRRLILDIPVWIIEQSICEIRRKFAKFASGNRNV